MTENQSSRRDFLKTSSVAVGAGLLAGSALPANAYAGGDDMIKIGLIGCGGRGTGAAAQALSTQGQVKLIAMADAFGDNLEKKHGVLQRQFGDKVQVPKERRFTGFDAYQKLVDIKELDVVVMATPPGFRPMQFEEAIRQGKHVFFEKPVAVDAGPQEPTCAEW